MEMVEKVIETRQVARKELIDYFRSIKGEYLGEGKFVGEHWKVLIGEEKDVFLGSIKFISILVTFQCEEKLIDKMINAFRLKFLRGGG